MDRNEAKRILSLCRPDNEEDLNDPLIAEAFAITENDDNLRIWVENERTADARICAEFERIEIPPGLKTSILSGIQAHQASDRLNEEAEADIDKKKIPFPGLETKNRARNPWISIAAILAVLLTISIIQRNRTAPKPTQIANIETPALIHFLAKEIKDLNAWNFDKRDKTLNGLQTYLANTGSPSPQSIPQFAESLPTIGCVVFNFEGNELSMICFKGNQVYHLITADKSTLGNQLPQISKVFENRDLTFKTWQNHKQVYILAVEGNRENLPEFI